MPWDEHKRTADPPFMANSYIFVREDDDVEFITIDQMVLLEIHGDLTRIIEALNSAQFDGMSHVDVPQYFAELYTKYCEDNGYD